MQLFLRWCVHGADCLIFSLYFSLSLVQTEEFRGGGRGGRGGGRQGVKESGLHQLYLDVISIVPLRKGSRKRKSEVPNSPEEGKSSDLGDEDKAEVDADFSQADLTFIRSLALSPCCVGLLISSLCTSIFGHELVKMGLLLGLFGGSSTASSDGTSDDSFHQRSDIHVLVVGDPGLGKSQMLRSAASVAPRSVMVCGNTSSTAGLTVSVVREQGGGGDMCLEAGGATYHLHF